MTRAILAALIGLCIVPASEDTLHAADTPPPTQQQMRACTPDARRFCSEFISLRGALSGMEACMVAHKAQLSAACREAIR